MAKLIGKQVVLVLKLILAIVFLVWFIGKMSFEEIRFGIVCFAALIVILISGAITLRFTGLLRPWHDCLKNDKE